MREGPVRFAETGCTTLASMDERTDADSSIPLIAAALRAGRERAGLSQEQVAGLVGVSHVTISHWEHGRRRPRDVHLRLLARLYDLRPDDLMEEPDQVPHGEALARLAVEGRRKAADVHGVRAALRLLDDYAELASAMGVDLRPLRHNPFRRRNPLDNVDDGGRRAQDVRRLLDIGSAPVADARDLCERLGITTCAAPLGGALHGAYFRHHAIGLVILADADATRDERSAAFAHELGRALFLDVADPYHLCKGWGARETSTDRFAHELLVPEASLRAYLEEVGIEAPIDDPIDVVRLQQHFHLGWQTTLDRLRSLRLLPTNRHRDLSAAPPSTEMLQALGVPACSDGPIAGTIEALPAGFVRLVRRAAATGVLEEGGPTKLQSVDQKVLGDIIRCA